MSVSSAYERLRSDSGSSDNSASSSSSGTERKTGLAARSAIRKHSGSGKTSLSISPIPPPVANKVSKIQFRFQGSNYEASLFRLDAKGGKTALKVTEQMLRTLVDSAAQPIMAEMQKKNENLLNHQFSIIQSGNRVDIRDNQEQTVRLNQKIKRKAVAAFQQLTHETQRSSSSRSQRRRIQGSTCPQGQTQQTVTVESDDDDSSTDSSDSSLHTTRTVKQARHDPSAKESALDAPVIDANHEAIADLMSVQKGLTSQTVACTLQKLFETGNNPNIKLQLYQPDVQGAQPQCWETVVSKINQRLAESSSDPRHQNYRKTYLFRDAPRNEIKPGETWVYPLHTGSHFVLMALHLDDQGQYNFYYYDPLGTPFTTAPTSPVHQEKGLFIEGSLFMQDDVNTMYYEYNPREADQTGEVLHCGAHIIRRCEQVLRQNDIQKLVDPQRLHEDIVRYRRDLVSYWGVAQRDSGQLQYEERIIGGLEEELDDPNLTATRSPAQSNAGSLSTSTSISSPARVGSPSPPTLGSAVQDIEIMTQKPSVGVQIGCHWPSEEDSISEQIKTQLIRHKGKSIRSVCVSIRNPSSSSLPPSSSIEQGVTTARDKAKILAEIASALKDKVSGQIFLHCSEQDQNSWGNAKKILQTALNQANISNVSIESDSE